MKSILIKCKTCGRDFLRLNSSTREYCSKECHPIKYCKTCGKAIKIMDYARYELRKYCTYECFKREKEYKELRCVICYKRIKVRKGQSKRVHNAKKYCSDECNKIGRTKEQKKDLRCIDCGVEIIKIVESNAEYNKRKRCFDCLKKIKGAIKYTCKYCGNEYELLSNNAKREYCTDECSQKAFEEEMRAGKFKMYEIAEELEEEIDMEKHNAL